MNTSTQSKPKIFQVILLSLLYFVNFYVAYTSTILIILLILFIVALIPIAGEILYKFLSMILWMTDGSLSFASMYYALVAAYFASQSLLNRLIKHNPTHNLSLRLSGIYLIVINTALLIVPLFQSSYEIQSWQVSIGFIVAGIITFFSANA